MGHVPERYDRTPSNWWDQVPPGSNPSGEVVVGGREDKIIYGPKGDVLKRIEDRPFLGYHRDNGR